MERVTRVNQIEVQENGVVQVRFQKAVLDNEAVVASSWHRTVFEPGVDFDAQMALVNESLRFMGEAVCEDVEALRAHVSLAHTPEKVTAFLDAKSKSGQ